MSIHGNIVYSKKMIENDLSFHLAENGWENCCTEYYTLIKINELELEMGKSQRKYIILSIFLKQQKIHKLVYVKQ